MRLAIDSRIAARCLLLTALVMFAGCAAVEPILTRRCDELSTAIRSDHANFYDHDTLRTLGVATVCAGVLAVTPLDEEIRQGVQGNVRSRSNDRVTDVLETVGDGLIVLPAYGALMLARECYPHGATDWCGELSERCLRTTLVGAPTLLALQWGLGASRPGEVPEAGSLWRPFQDANAASGHTFLGSILFLNAAEMTDEPWAKKALVAGSTITGLCRINDDAHYTSQVVLGWCVGYVATAAVSESCRGFEHCTIRPLVTEDGTGVTVELRY